MCYKISTLLYITLYMTWKTVTIPTSYLEPKSMEIVIVNLYSATSRETPQRRSRPDNTKPRSKRMVFKRLRKRGKDRPRSSLRRLSGKLFQKDGSDTAKLLWSTVEVRTIGITRSPCVTERRNLLYGLVRITPAHTTP